MVGLLRKQLKIGYLLFFIFLNVIDFFNVIPEDLDFFKKLLSWTLIGYLIYKASISRVLVGKRVKVIDFVYVLVAFLVVSLRDLLFYVTAVRSSPGVLFAPIIVFLSKYLSEYLLLFAFLGLVLLFFIAIELSKVELSEHSLVGSVLSGRRFGRFLKIPILYVAILFFTFTVYNFFMEWFALAIDSFVLMIGLLYYSYKFFSEQVFGSTFGFLSEISNTGNLFYLNLIEKFSDRRTLFMGIAFLLSMHLVVDFVVFLVPALIGLKNGLYSLSSEFSFRPFFSFFPNHFKDTVFYESYKLVSYSHGSFLSFLVNIFHFLFNYFFFSMSLLLPFYVFYSEINNEVPKLKKWIVVLYIVSGLYYVANLVFGNNSINVGFFDKDILGVRIFFCVLRNFYVALFFLLLCFCLFVWWMVFGKDRFLRIVMNILVAAFFVVYISIYSLSYLSSFEFSSGKVLHRDFGGSIERLLDKSEFDHYIRTPFNVSYFVVRVNNSLYIAGMFEPSTRIIYKGNLSKIYFENCSVYRDGGSVIIKPEVGCKVIVLSDRVTSRRLDINKIGLKESFMEFEIGDLGVFKRMLYCITFMCLLFFYAGGIVYMLLFFAREIRSKLGY